MRQIRYTKGNDDGKRGGFKPYPAGLYDLQIATIEESRNSKGNPQLTFKSVIVGDHPYAGKKVTWWRQLQENSIWVLERDCKAIGMEPQDTGDVDEDGKKILAFDIDELIGRTVTAQCSLEEYQGKTKNEWEIVGISTYDALGPGSKPSSSSQQAEPAPAGETTTSEAAPKPATGNQGVRRRPESA